MTTVDLPVSAMSHAMKSGQPLPLEAKSLSKTFQQGLNRVQALEEFSFQVLHGEFVAIMGASGSGKSTLLNLIAGIAKPDSGKVLIGGEDLTALKDPQLTKFRRRKIGLIFQSFNLIPTLSALDNVLLPVLAGAPQGEFSPQQLLEKVGLAQRAAHRPDALSGGEQQRVAIARSLISSPEIVLADEPTGSLDSVNSQAICQLLRDLCNQWKRSVVVVTHEPEVAYWADRVVVLRDGRKLLEFETKQFDSAASLAAHYREAINAKSSKGAGK